MVDLILLGAPGAGKGTQAELMADWLPLPRVSTGDLFRAALSQGTPLGVRAKHFMDAGELVPDEVTVGMVEERISQVDCARGVVFDGFPRTVAQAAALDELLADMGRQVDLVVYIQVSEETLLRRLAGRWTCKDCGRVYHREFSPENVQGVCDSCQGELFQREDDTEETQRRRIAVYNEQTAPLEAHYRAQGNLVDVDGEQGVDDVQAAIKLAVEAFH